MSKKIDLEELERNAREWSQEDADWYPGYGPRFTLALIARIRDLESGLLQCGQTFAGQRKPPSPAELIELIERGAALP
jgi:hypothetical protein